ncbi:hypothetical protein EII20_07030 [Comamonadaceae bacterium OH2545_COT-014]|nr:hypothetical protein EII20_07030 [Comamonadaceae bacterium OH2545_COT-014]
MKFQPDPSGPHTITAYGPGWVALGNERFTRSLLVLAGSGHTPWGAATFDELTEADFAQLADAGPELVIFGSGERLRFPRPAWLRPLAGRRIGLETMSTPAACRTYNILAGEGRRVLAALLIGESSG